LRDTSTGARLLIMADDTSTFMELTASIVSAYVRHNSVPSAELPGLIGQVHTALMGVSSGHGEALANALRPAISIKKSIAPDYIICLEDGKKFKSLKRHLRTHYDLTPEQYREKWSLASDYPMVAPNYAAARSRLAKQMGLGQPPCLALVGALRYRNLRDIQDLEIKYMVPFEWRRHQQVLSGGISSERARTGSCAAISQSS
jgi:predicted transcriptional regulator